jgi:hypothetical protein
MNFIGHLAVNTIAFALGAGYQQITTSQDFINLPQRYKSYCTISGALIAGQSVGLIANRIERKIPIRISGYPLIASFGAGYYAIQWWETEQKMNI